MYSEIPTRTHPVRALWSMGEGGRSREGSREREYNMLRARVMWDMATDLSLSPPLCFLPSALRSFSMAFGRLLT